MVQDAAPSAGGRQTIYTLALNWYANRNVRLMFDYNHIDFQKYNAATNANVPLGAPIGSGMGIQNQAHIRILREMMTGVPLIVDAGVGTASDAAIAMELGADAVLMNTGIANAQDPVLMAEAMKHAVIAGREAYLAGRMEKKLYATASSPLEGVVR